MKKMLLLSALLLVPRLSATESPANLTHQLTENLEKIKEIAEHIRTKEEFDAIHLALNQIKYLVDCIENAASEFLKEGDENTVGFKKEVDTCVRVISRDCHVFLLRSLFEILFSVSLQLGISFIGP